MRKRPLPTVRSVKTARSLLFCGAITRFQQLRYLLLLKNFRCRLHRFQITGYIRTAKIYSSFFFCLCSLTIAKLSNCLNKTPIPGTSFPITPRSLNNPIPAFAPDDGFIALPSETEDKSWAVRQEGVQSTIRTGKREKKALWK